jgi:hypothetical protein
MLSDPAEDKKCRPHAMSVQQIEDAIRLGLGA